MAKYQILYWKEIPAQVKAYDGVRAVSRQLPERYQLEIDRVVRDLETWLIVIVLGGLILLGAAQIVLRNFFSIGFAWNTASKKRA